MTIYYISFFGLIETDSFQLEDASSEKEYGYRLKDSLQTARNMKLFTGLKIHVTKRTKPKPAEIKGKLAMI